MLLRAPWPLVPRPAVLPPLPPMPRPTRRFGLVDPGAGCRSWTFMSSDFLGGDEVRDPGDHPPDLGTVGQRVRLADPAEAEGAQRAAGGRLRPDGRADLGDLQLAGHDY